LPHSFNCDRVHLGWGVIIAIAFAFPCDAQLTRQNISTILGFENGTPGAFPAGGWTSNDAREAVIDAAVAHGGKYSVRIERGASSNSTNTFLLAAIPVDFAGQTIELRGFAKTENVTDRVVLAVVERATENGANLELGSTLSSGVVRGTTDWKEYSTSVPAVPSARVLQVFTSLDPARRGLTIFNCWWTVNRSPKHRAAYLAGFRLHSH